MSYKAMDLIHNVGEKQDKKLVHLGFQDDDMQLIIIRLPNSSWVLKLMTRALILSLIMLSLPWLNLVMEDLMNSNMRMGSSSFDSINDIHAAADTYSSFPVLYKEFANEGFLKTGDKVLILSNGNRVEDEMNAAALDAAATYKIETMNPDDIMKATSGAYDLVLVHDFPSSSSLINRVLKPLGVIVVLLRDNNNPKPTFQKPMNYKVIYLRSKLGSTVMAMRRMYQGLDQEERRGGRRLLGIATESKKAALSHLEDVLLEPPRAASGKSTRYLKKTKYLPDLIGDSLSSYPRRIFIDVNLLDKTNSPSRDDDEESWFWKHYPTRNTEFDIYKVDAIGGSDGKKEPKIGMSDWLRANVKENEYVVMKAEAEVVEEMMKTKAIRLVDELFLECKHRGIKKSETRSRRAYWECLALYGRLRDEGIAVHQWWG